jgi:hypothetical protein
MNVARHDRRARFGVKDRGIFRPLCSHATEPRISIHFAPVADVPDVLTGPEIHIPRSAAVDSNAKYILSKDRGMRHNVGLDSVVLRRSHRDPPPSTGSSKRMLGSTEMHVQAKAFLRGKMAVGS